VTTRGLQPPPFESARTALGDHSLPARDLASGGPAQAARGHAAGEAAAAEGGEPQLPVCLVGPGWRFTSGISYYTCRLANSMAGEQCDTSVILLRRLLPRLLYPGKARVGLKRASMEYAAGVRVFDGIDWWWGTSVLRALRFLRSRRPRVLVLQWWTAATLHTYLLLAAAARLSGIRVVIELHELQDPGEAGLALARGYGRWGLRALIRLAHGAVVHSKSDWQLFESSYGPMDVRVALVPRPLRPVPRHPGNRRPGRRRRGRRGPRRPQGRHGQPAVLRPHPPVQGPRRPAPRLVRPPCDLLSIGWHRRPDSLLQCLYRNCCGHRGREAAGGRAYRRSRDPWYHEVPFDLRN